ncbi:MAG: zinc-binding dehydrogenase [bacterium]
MADRHSHATEQSIQRSASLAKTVGHGNYPTGLGTDGLSVRGYTIKTEAIVFSAPGKVEIWDVELPDLGPDDVDVELEYSSISVGTERWCYLGKLQGFTNPFPHAAGYQGAGHVCAVGRNVKNLKPGDRVFSPCCRQARNFEGAWWGGHVHHHITHCGNVIKLPDKVSLLDASGLVLAQVGYNGAMRPRVNKGDAVLVIGDGCVGQYAGQAFRALGAYVILAGHHSFRLEIALKTGGADEVFNSRENDLEKYVRSKYPTGVPLTVETAGKAELIKLAVELSVYNGQFVLLGYYPSGECIIDTHWIRAKETTVYCPNGWEAGRLQGTLGLVSEGKMTVEKLVTHEFSYKDAAKAYELTMSTGTEYLGIGLRWS